MGLMDAPDGTATKGVYDDEKNGDKDEDDGQNPPFFLNVGEKSSFT